MSRRWALTLSMGLGCRATAEPDRHTTSTRRVVVTAPDLPEALLNAVTIEPVGALRAATRIGRKLELTLDARPKKILLRAPEACPVELGPASESARDEEAVRIVPLLSLSGPAGEVGFDALFEVSARLGCSEAREGSVSWSNDGSPLAETTVASAGLRFVGRTTRMPARLAHSKPGRIVPVSPAARASTRIVARWTSPKGAVVERSTWVSAAPRSRGLPNVAIGERVLLGGTGYAVLRRPDASLADPMPWGGLTSFLPDRAGSWELARPGGTSISLYASRYDSVPLDCGRIECHAAEAYAAQDSPMTQALARLFEAPEAPGALGCTFGCHTTGEPGAADGGFSHALGDFELDAASLPAWTALPRALRRLGGVGCLGCHGPGQVPEVSASWAILRSDVCAYCHDAPPRYGHVRAWSSSRMAEADAFPDARTNASCARCHTTWGFLDATSQGRAHSRMPPDDEPAIGIACAACHAVHDEDAVMPGLLRRVKLGEDYADLPASAVERSGACIVCHAPEDDGPSSSLIWAGRGAKDPISQTALVGPAPHAAVPGGCVGCHRAGPEGLERGSGHAFRADMRRCASCHAARPIDSTLFDRARRLLAEEATETLPGHARPSRARTPSARARALARLVLEDPGAAVHNPRYADALLDRAASVLASLPEGSP